MLYIYKKRFFKRRKNKLFLRSDRLFRVLKWVGESVYKIELIRQYGVSVIFNVEDIVFYYSGELRATVFEEGEIDTGELEVLI